MKSTMSMTSVLTYGAIGMAVTALAIGLANSSSIMQMAERMRFQASSNMSQPDYASAAVPTTGNGGPSGAHYNLNIIGVPKGKTGDFTGGNRIFVPLTGKTNISLSEGDFMVLDGNATDGKGAFQLPNPDPENTGYTTYSVYARALGKPGGKSTTTPCATDPTVVNEDGTTGATYCSTQSLVSVRGTGKQKFSNVSSQLLYAYIDLDGDGTVERYPLFDDRLVDYYWNYDNQGLKLLQLRFYPISTNVN